MLGGQHKKLMHTNSSQTYLKLMVVMTCLKLIL